MDKNKCGGCYNDFYNYRKNCDGKSECWNLKDAKIVWRKEVHINQMPPFKQAAKRFPSCYHRPQYVYIEPKRLY